MSSFENTPSASIVEQEKCNMMIAGHRVSPKCTRLMAVIVAVLVIFLAVVPSKKGDNFGEPSMTDIEYFPSIPNNSV